MFRDSSLEWTPKEIASVVVDYFKCHEPLMHRNVFTSKLVRGVVASLNTEQIVVSVVSQPLTAPARICEQVINDVQDVLTGDEEHNNFYNLFKAIVNSDEGHFFYTPIGTSKCLMFVYMVLCLFKFELKITQHRRKLKDQLAKGPGRIRGVLTIEGPSVELCRQLSALNPERFREDGLYYPNNTRTLQMCQLAVQIFNSYEEYGYEQKQDLVWVVEPVVTFIMDSFRNLITSTRPEQFGDVLKIRLTYNNFECSLDQRAGTRETEGSPVHLEKVFK